MHIAIMIPLDEQTAHESQQRYMRPDGWTREPVLQWPERLSPKSGWYARDIASYAPFPHETAALVGHMIAEQTEPRMVIVTRSEMVVLRVRRMIAEGADITASVYCVSAAGQERHDIAPTGEMLSWPDGLFHDSFREATAICRAMRERNPQALERSKAAT